MERARYGFHLHNCFLAINKDFAAKLREINVSICNSPSQIILGQASFFLYEISRLRRLIGDRQRKRNGRSAAGYAFGLKAAF